MNRQLTEQWNTYVELRHLWTGALHHNGAQRSGEILMNDGFGVGAGVTYRF